MTADSAVGRPSRMKAVEKSQMWNLETAVDIKKNRINWKNLGKLSNDEITKQITDENHRIKIIKSGAPSIFFAQKDNKKKTPKE